MKKLSLLSVLVAVSGLSTTFALTPAYEYEKVALVLDKWFSNVSIPGEYMTRDVRRKFTEDDFDLTNIPTFNVDHEHGVHTNWLHHTFPNEIFKDVANVRKAKHAIAKLLWRGLSKVKDSAGRLLGAAGIRDNDVENYLIAISRIVQAYEDFFEQIENTFSIGEQMITNPRDVEYGPETNFWSKFRPFISCHHQKRLGPEVGGSKIWCNPDYLEEASNEGATRRYVLSAGSGGDFSYEEYLTKTFSNLVIVTPDCTTFEEQKWSINEAMNSSTVMLPVCLTGEDGRYTTHVHPSLRPKFIRFEDLCKGLNNFFGESFYFTALKVNIEGFEYPLFADVFKNEEKLLKGTKQIHIELHRQGMQRWGLNWNSLVLGELLIAHFYSGGFIPFAAEKWHDSTAASDIAFVNSTWFMISENLAKNKRIYEVHKQFVDEMYL